MPAGRLRSADSRRVPIVLSALTSIAPVAIPLAGSAAAAHPKPSITGFVASPTTLKSPPLCPIFTADDSQGIGGSGSLQLESSGSPEQIVGYFDFAVDSQLCGSPPVGTSFGAHISGTPAFTPGSTKSVWPSDGGGTFTFDRVYP